MIENESYYCQTSYSSAQEVELFAVLQALQRVPQSFNLYSDSHYVVRALSVIETVPLIGAAKASFQTLFLKIQDLIQARNHPYFFGHIHAHTALPRHLTSGNALADEATRMVCYSSLTAISVAQALMQYTIRIAIHYGYNWNFWRGRSSHYKNVSYLPADFCSSHL